MFLEIYNKIKEYDTIIIHRHAKPDCDALGSQIGLKNAIIATFPNKCVKATGDMVERYNWFEKMDTVYDDDYKNALIIVCDSGAEKMISDERYKKGSFLIKIDHHIPQGQYGDIAYVDTNSESCSSIIAELVKKTPLVMNKKAAQNLFVGMVTDSGRFRYSQTSSRTFEIASYLMQFNINIDQLYNKIYLEKLYNVKLKAKLISKFKVTKNGVAYLINTYQDVLKYNLPIFDISRGMVNIMSGIEGINIWANFTETETKEVYCELRSNGVNINKVATIFGGGGHLQASGCTLKSLEQVKEVLKELNKVAGDSYEK